MGALSPLFRDVAFFTVKIMVGLFGVKQSEPKQVFAFQLPSQYFIHPVQRDYSGAWLSGFIFIPNFLKPFVGYVLHYIFIPTQHIIVYIPLTKVQPPSRYMQGKTAQRSFVLGWIPVELGKVKRG